MAVTTNALLPVMATGSLGKEVIFSDAMAMLDDLVGGYGAKSVAGSAHVTLTEAEARHAVIELTGVLTGSINVIVPTRDKWYVVFNNTTGAFTVTFKTTAGTGPIIPQGLHAILYCNAVNIIQVGTFGGSGNLTLKNGTAQAAAVDTVSLWEADTAGVAGKGGLHIMAEDGTQHVLGDIVGLGVITGFVANVKLQIRGADGAHGSIACESFFATSGGNVFRGHRARGTAASPTVLNDADRTVELRGYAWARDAADTLTDWVQLGNIRIAVDSKDGQSRMGGRIDLQVSPGVSAAVATVATLTKEGNLILGAGTTFGTSAVRVFVVSNGTAPATSPADMTQIWSADQEGVAGQSALHILDETGVTTSIGKGILVRRVIEASTAGSGAPNVLLASESNKILSNEGSAARNYHTLPTAVAGLVYTFVIQDADGMRIKADTGDTIRVAAGVTAAAGYIENGAIGDVITLVAINATEWWDIASRGTWTPT